jgi:hypothetical protein
MPEVSGLDFVMAQGERQCKCRNYAVMSGSWTEEQRALALELECQVIEKPFETKPLIKWLEIGETQISPERILNNWFQEKLEKKL